MGTARMQGIGIHIAVIVCALGLVACGGDDQTQVPDTPPTAYAGPDQRVLEGSRVLLNGAASTPRGANLRYAWTQGAGGSRVAISNADAAEASFVLPDGSDRAKIIFTLTVTDGQGRTSTDDVAIKVLFEPWRNLRNICQTPRPSDARGSTEDEKNFLRSFTNDTYLWYDEVDYADPSDARHSVAEYFDLMKTNDKTPSGNPKDRFHFSQSTEQWLASRRQGTYVGYGIRLTVVDGEVLIADAEPDSAAGRNGLSRGAHIVSVEDRTYAEAEGLSDFLYPRRSNPVSEYAFKVRDLGATTTRTFRMQAGEVNVDSVRHTRVIDTDTGKVGYIFFKTHNSPSEAELIDTFRELVEDEVTDLVLDLRYNGGGFLFIANEVAFMIAGHAATSGKIFRRLLFNDKHPSINPFRQDPIGDGYPFFTTAYGFSAAEGTPLPTLNLDRVFILTTGSTCSASESIINGLHGIDVEVILIGDTTCGKPYGFYSTDNCGTTYSTVNYTGINDKGFGHYPEGFGPQNAAGAKSMALAGCAVADDLGHAFGDPDEAQLAAALQYRVDGSCPESGPQAARPVALDENPWDIGIIMVE